MGGPTRSRSRSTTVVAGAAGSGKKKRYARGNNKKHNTAPASWDHDNSSGSDDDDAVETKAATVPDKKGKRPLNDIKKTSVNEMPKDSRRDVENRKTTKGTAKKRQRMGPGDGDGGDDSEPASSDAGESEKDDAEDLSTNGEAGAAAAVGGGMGDVMARILGQKVDTRTQAPVLAKRKTKTMKEMEEASAKRAASRGKSAAKRANMTQQFVIPDHTTTDYERQLKKIATRGVVALFNAISKRQQQEPAIDGDASEKTRRTAKAEAVKGASRHAFLDMLKSGVKPAAGGAAGGAGGSRGGGIAAMVEGGAAWSKEADDKEEGSRSWSVLKEDYMLGASSMKNWDQESAESEPDALAGGSAMSDSD